LHCTTVALKIRLVVATRGGVACGGLPFRLTLAGTSGFCFRYVAAPVRHPVVLERKFNLGTRSVEVKQRIPWQLKFAAKLILSRLPLDYHLWKKAGLFDLGGMERPEYALGIFRRHFNAANFTRKSGDFTALELGPGDSLFSGLIARTFGASRTCLVDVGPFAATNLACYRKMESHLRDLGFEPPNLKDCSTFDELKTSCAVEYLTDGLASLRQIPSSSIDFTWSHAVLAHVRRDEFLPTLLELRRIQRPGGVSSHHTGFGGILGGGMNDLRFSERVWESSFMANSGFYTNRIHYEELLQLFQKAGFEPEISRMSRFTTLPIPRRKMATEFAGLRDEDLQVSSVDVLLH
jgi:SAM-dependent methyltransferase